MGAWSFLIVAVGGFVGGVIRYVLTSVMGTLWGIATANSVACFLVGAASTHGALNLVVTTGIAAALSTWPALAAELGRELHERRYFLFAFYLVANLALGHVAAFIGSQLAVPG